MAKLKMLSMHKIENVPDHIIQQMQEFSKKLVIHNISIVQSVDPNIALAGLNWMLAAMLKQLISDNPEELRKAVKFSCEMLIGNMEMLIKLDE